MNDKLSLLFTGDEITVNRIKIELQAAGINCLIKDGFKQGLEAGFGGGVPSAIDVYVYQNHLEKASEIVKAITEN